MFVGDGLNGAGVLRFLHTLLARIPVSCVGY